MPQMNGSLITATEFIIGGIPGLESYEKELFALFLIIYIFTLLGNVCVIVLIVADRRLHTPMYFFIANLSLVDLVTTTTVSPKMLSAFLLHDNIISYSACFLQMYVFLSSECTVCFMLAVMAFDRYVAICNPLRYSSIITNKTCILLAGCTWLSGFSFPAVSVYQTLHLQFCGPYTIPYCFCDFPPVLLLACSDTSAVIQLGLTLALVGINFPFVFVIASYAKILISILKIASRDGRRKAFLTCSSHLLSVFTFYASSAFMYALVRSEAVSLQARTLITLSYAVFLPMINPLIYSFRNKDIKNAMGKLLYGSVSPFP
ncbi:olfactory receptor 2AT4-like [Erpetoichthys calabaricus]|uniref:olfactory receptor 2AT4-like n=1 Tax=Erpetoichthys calabaricus TaxID=27687 RepID=UPI0022341F2E|nr:olfactory receptor 2AT4-like [Erpetoichthys calabaricus]